MALSTIFFLLLPVQDDKQPAHGIRQPCASQWATIRDCLDYGLNSIIHRFLFDVDLIIFSPWSFVRSKKGDSTHKNETFIRVALYARNERYARPGRFTTGLDVIDAAKNVIIESGWPNVLLRPLDIEVLQA